MSAAEEIAKFYELFKAGAITEAEFTTAKAKLLGAAPTPPTDTRGAAAIKPKPADQGGKPKQSAPQPAQKNGGVPSPIQTGVAVAAGMVGGRLISDKLLDDPSTDPTAFATETITFPDGDVVTGAAFEMPNGDVFYSVTETSGLDVHTVAGSMTAEEAEAFVNEDTSSGHDFGGHDHEVHTHVESYSYDSGSSAAESVQSDSGGFDGFDFF
jgi:hypothetical protein